MSSINYLIHPNTPTSTHETSEQDRSNSAFPNIKYTLLSSDTDEYFVIPKTVSDVLTYVINPTLIKHNFFAATPYPYYKSDYTDNKNTLNLKLAISKISNCIEKLGFISFKLNLSSKKCNINNIEIKPKQQTDYEITFFSLLQTAMQYSAFHGVKDIYTKPSSHMNVDVKDLIKYGFSKDGEYLPLKNYSSLELDTLKNIPLSFNGSSNGTVPRIIFNRTTVELFPRQLYNQQSSFLETQQECIRKISLFSEDNLKACDVEDVNNTLSKMIELPEELSQQVNISKDRLKNYKSRCYYFSVLYEKFEELKKLWNIEEVNELVKGNIKDGDRLIKEINDHLPDLRRPGIDNTIKNILVFDLCLTSNKQLLDIQDLAEPPAKKRRIG